MNKSQSDALLTLSSELCVADEGVYVEPSPVAAAPSPPPTRPSSASVAQRCKRGSANDERGTAVKFAAVNRDFRLVLSKQSKNDRILERK